VSLANIKLGCKDLQGSNTLAYLSEAAMTKKHSFKKFASTANRIKIIFIANTADQ
jgi:hypothetical protein